MLNIPVSTYDKYLGKPLNLVIEDGRITNIPIKIEGKDINFLDTIRDKTNLLSINHKDNINSFDSGFNFYLLRDRIQYILAIKQLGDSFVKIKYSLSGVIINSVTDTNVHDGGNDFFIRKSGNKEILFDVNYKPVKLIENITLRPIEKVKENKKLFVSDPNLGVIDTETFLSNDGTQKIYALGFKTNLQDDPVIYYIDKNELDSSKIVLEMINELLRPKYNKTHFYCHNLSGYDVVFILKILCEHNDSSYDKYTINSIIRDDKIIKITISKDNRSFSITDSYCMLNSSLDSLSKSFGVDCLKSIFPYKFSIESNLFYKGNTPDKQYYNNISDKEYDNIYIKD
jgi:hypothetical protein